jgi:hypothetical protein
MTMHLLKDLASVAPLLTALVAFGALLLAVITFLFVTRDHRSRYRPYVYGQVGVEPLADSIGCVVAIEPINVGGHPCEIKISSVVLTIGDESYTTPDMQNFMLLGQKAISRYPAGHVNELGVQKIRDGRFKTNRVELSFAIDSRSIDHRYVDRTRYAHEIDVRSERPQAFTRADWIRRA